MDGVLIVNKPAGPTSHDVVARARRALGTPRIGHTGTLDPAASGVLPLVVGRATRLARFLTSSTKEYVARVRFGRTTDTYDAAGEVVFETGRAPDREALERVLGEFVGTFPQTPPAYSAKKIDGVRAYALARRQAAVSPAPVEATVHRLVLARFDSPVAEIELTCSAGFYVRSLAHDLGQRLGTGALLDALVRTRAGAFTLDQAVALDTLVPEERDALASRLLPPEAAVAHLPAIRLTDAGVRRVRHGQNIGPADMLPSPPSTSAVPSASPVSSVPSVFSAALESSVPSAPSAALESSVSSAPSAALEPSVPSVPSVSSVPSASSAFGLFDPAGRLVGVGARIGGPSVLHASIVLR